MTTCCPNCSSPDAMGTDIASICTECASVTVAGASISLPAIVACAALVVTAGLLVNMFRRARTLEIACA